MKSDYEALKTTEHGAKMCKQLEDLPGNYTITTVGAPNTAWYNGEKLTIRIDPGYRPVIDTSEGRMHSDPISLMGHEVGHAATKTFDEMTNINNNENPIRKELGLPPRTSHKAHKSL
ncbi:hypothetical protein [Pseudomonas anguilliseptica]|uniref:hypothetical protein n=1 Tax=Pseudomonas anguilliseptica TaxID=53406 RepID=UPI00325A7139